ncbi:MAG: hypothetical protein NT062_17550 [Proteobacteria bacterium]|nr:hypothetical protein [Pseudomonadota bacterium]
MDEPRVVRGAEAREQLADDRDRAVVRDRAVGDERLQIAPA